MTPVSDAEAAQLFRHFAGAPALILGVSGGPDSTALMVLAARWRRRRKSGPKIIAVTVDHGLRPQARREAADVKRLARELGVDHRTVKWTASKPTTGLQEKARLARYALLAAAAQRAGAPFVITAHTRDDQAETMLFRMARGSGLAGLAGMAAVSPVPADADIVLYRPLLEISKARLVATLKARRIAFAEDPSNADVKFTRVRWRALMPHLAREGMDAARLSVLARRLRRANAALERVVDAVGADDCDGEGWRADRRAAGAVPRIAGRDRAAAGRTGGKSGRHAKGRWNSPSWRTSWPRWPPTVRRLRAFDARSPAPW